MKNLLIAQSGGPTSAINATLAGAISFAYTSKKINKVLGAINGIEGVLNENFVEINKKIRNCNDFEILSQTPAAALGSCRYKLGKIDEQEKEYKKIIDIFYKNNIGYFIYIGGNDSMDTVNKLSDYCKKNNIEDIKIIGVPKTIDNDLAMIDHCPGFGSAAKYIATTIAELERDCSVYNKKSVTIVEIMGRNAGWLTASSAMAKIAGGKGPSLIYLCESTFDEKQFIIDVKEKLQYENNILVAVSEGIKNKNGIMISKSVQSGVKDVFGHEYIAGVGRVLEQLVRKEIGCKVRSVELNIMQRCSSHITSATDIEESKLLGMKACQCAIEGDSGVMVTLLRKANEPYEIEVSSVPVSLVANIEKKVPKSWISKKDNNVTQEMIEYLLPLIQGENTNILENGIPKHIYLY